MPIGDHFYTTSIAERDNAVANYGYTNEGTACHVFDWPLSGTSPFYRLLNPATGDHFYTTSQPERNNAIAQFGYTDEGIACYVFDWAAPGTSAFHRLLNQINGDHFYTTSTSERDNAAATLGYTYEGIACYVYTSQWPPTAAAVTRRFYRLRKTKGTHAFDVNIILVGVEAFTAADHANVRNAIRITRDIFGKVDLAIEAVSFFQISLADAGAHATIDSGGEAEDLTEDWTVPNNALDAFVVRVMNGADGRSAVDGPCDKDAKGMTGCVVSLNGSPDNIGNTFAHEIGHYMGLGHIPDACNFIGGNGASDSCTGIRAGQGNKMKKHCFVRRDP